MRKWVTKNQYTIYQLLKGGSSVFAVSNGNSLLIVDTSLKPGWKELCRNIDSLTANNEKVTALIITHAHNDHTENAADLKEKYKLKLIAHKNEAKYITSGDSSIPEGTNALTRFIANSFMKTESGKLRMKYKPAVVDIEVEDKYDLSSFGFNAYIIHTPGHTYGSMSIIVDNEIALVGDAMSGLFNSICPPFALDTKLMAESWKRLLDTGCSVYLPSHGTEDSREFVSKQYEKYSL